MQTHAHETVVIPELQQFEKQVREAIMMLCRIIWQHASKSLQLKYPLYALERKTCETLVNAYLAGVRDKGYYSLDVLIAEVINPLTGLSKVFKDDWRDRTDVADKMLVRASYASCILGNIPCIGDLEFEIELSESGYAWGDSAIHPATSYAEYKKNNPRLLLEYLNDQLVVAIEDLAQIDLKQGNRNIVNHVPSVWVHDSSKRPMLSEEILETEYHLYFSLLRLVQSDLGNA